MCKSSTYNCRSLLLLVAIVGLLVSCHKQAEEQASRTFTDAESLVDSLNQHQNYQEMIVVADSLLAAKAITELQANYMLGIAHHNLTQHRAAIYYYRKVVEAGLGEDCDSTMFVNAACYLSMLLKGKEDYGGALRVALPVVTTLEHTGYTHDRLMLHLKSTIGLCQIHLGSLEEGERSLDDAFSLAVQLAEGDSIARSYDDMTMTAINAATNYLNEKQIEQASKWVDRSDSALYLYRKFPGHLNNRVDLFQCRVDLMRALVYNHAGEYDKAEAAFEKYCATDYAKTSVGKIDACEYLAECGRWEEAADNYKGLDSLMKHWGRELNLENIQQLVLPKFRAEASAGRLFSAMQTGMMLCAALDSAILWQKQSDAAELATIYDMQEKERLLVDHEITIEKQNSAITRERVIGIVIALVLIIVFLSVLSTLRQRSAKRLAAKNAELEQKNAELVVANARAKESSVMKTNFIHQVSHEIRTPLNILSGFTQVLTSSGSELDGPTRIDINKQITENTVRITKLVNKMLELSEANTQAVIERTDHVLPLLIAMKAIDASGIGVAKHLDFKVEAGEGTDSVVIVTELRQAVRALTLVLGNAAKFTKPTTQSVEAVDDKRCRASLVINILSDVVEFVVEDTGPGIPASEAEHIFEEFVQLDDNAEGTGIGLTLSRNIARRLGGDVVLDTSYKGGARFVMTLPLESE